MRFITLACLACLLPAPAHAGEVFGGILKHAVDTPLSLSDEDEGGLDLHLGYRGSGLGRTGLHLYAFAGLNTAGDTSYAAAGLSFRWGKRLYIRPGLGLAIHNGSAGDFEVPGNGEIEFGNRVLFEPELGLGYQANERLSVEASWVHMSQGQVFSGQNPGIDNIGVRLNWRL